MPSAMIGNLAVSLTMQTAAFQRGATIAEKRTEAMRGRFAAATTSVKGLGAAMGVTLGADVLYRITAGAFEMASSLQEAAEQVGVTVEGLQELRFAAEQTGIGADKMDAAMKRLNRSLGELQRGDKAITATFREIGLTADELRGKRPDEALRLIADALNQIPDAAQRVAIGQELMGRSFSDLLPLINGGSEALNEYAEANRQNGQISDEDARKLDELADNWGKFSDAVSVATANIIADAIPMVQAVIGGLDRIRMGIHLMREGWITDLNASAAAVGRFVEQIKSAITGTLYAVFDGAMRKIEAVRAAFFNLWDKVTRRSYIPDMVDDIAAEMRRLDAAMVRPVTAATTKAEQAFRDMASDVRALLDRLFPETAAELQFQANRARLNEIADPAARAAAQAALLAEREEALKRASRSGIVKDGAEDVAKPLTALDEAFNKVLEGLDEMGERSRETAVSVTQSFKQMADDTLGALSRLSGAIKSGGFLGILEAVIGVGLQLGSIGAFGKNIATRLNSPGSTSGGFISPPRSSGAASSTIEVVPSPYFNVVVDGRAAGVVGAAAPGIQRGAMAQAAFRQSRRLA